MLLKTGKALSSAIAPETLNLMLNVCAVDPASASVIAARNVPGPVSASEVTSKLESTVRSSRRSSSGPRLCRRRGDDERAMTGGRNRELAGDWETMGSKGNMAGSCRSAREKKKPHRSDCQAIGPS